MTHIEKLDFILALFCEDYKEDVEYDGMIGPSMSKKGLIGKSEIREPEVLLILNKLLKDGHIVEVGENLLTVTYGGFIFGLQNGYSGVILRDDALRKNQKELEANKIEREDLQLSVLRVQTEIQDSMRKLTKVLVFASIIAALAGLAAAVYYVVALVCQNY